MAVVYHGTTWEAYQNILKEGFNTGNKIWVCSDDFCTYAYERERYKMEHSIDDDEYSDLTNRIVSDCFESAAIAAAYNNVLDNRLIVIELDVPDNIVLEDESVYDDINGNRVMTTAVQIDNDELTNDMIKRVFISEYYAPSLRLIYVKFLLDGHPYFNTDTFSQLEIDIAKSISVDYCCLSDYLEWELFQDNTKAHLQSV